MHLYQYIPLRRCLLPYGRRHFLFYKIKEFEIDK